MQIDKIKTCKAITDLVELLKNYEFKIIEAKISDYHFHEVYIKMKGEIDNLPDTIVIKKIKSSSKYNFHCECHWSIVDVIIE